MQAHADSPVRAARRKVEVKLTPAEHDRLRRLSQQNHRTLAGEVRHALAPILDRPEGGTR